MGLHYGASPQQEKDARLERMPDSAYIREAADKPLRWMGSSKEDLSSFPLEVKKRMGFALRIAQKAGKAPYAKPLKGLGGAGLLEIVADHDGDTFRAAYTVRLAEIVYVLDAFQKKSKRGIATPRADMERIRRRLKGAEEDHKQWLEKKQTTSA